jgi:hypothetical protein
LGEGGLGIEHIELSSAAGILKSASQAECFGGELTFFNCESRVSLAWMKVE